MTQILSLGAQIPLLRRLFGRKIPHETSMEEVKRRLRIDLVDLPQYLKDDIGLNDD